MVLHSPQIAAKTSSTLPRTMPSSKRAAKTKKPKCVL